MQPTLALTLTRRASVRHTLLIDAILIFIGSVFVAALAQISIPVGSDLIAAFAQIGIPLPATPVPITGQTFAVLLVGATLGSKRGAASLALYAVEGAAGLPVFAGATGGMAKLLGPTGGYLVGFIAAAYIVGWLCERGLDRRWRTAIVPFLVGTVVIYTFGVPWLAVFIGPDKALAGGVYPFLIGDAIKLILAAIAMPSAWAFVKTLDRQ